MKQKATTTTKRKIEPVARASGSVVADHIEQLAKLFPDAVSEGEVDFERLRAALGSITDDGKERYSFTWAGKRDAIRLLQVPSRATLIPASKQSVSFEKSGNVFVEGDNLEVLKLLYKPYFGRVKMVYIDPPYNTGNDFIYPDNFADPLDSYLKLTGQKDTEGNLLTSNPESSGRYHSSWLSMMYPRLFIARQLLRDDGVIFVSIDDHEIHNLRLLMNDVFGEENLVAQFIWKRKAGGGDDSGHVAVEHEYILCFAKNSDTAKLGLIKHESPSMTAKYNRTENNKRFYLERLDKTSLTYNKSMDFEIRCPDGSQIRPPQPNPKHPSTSWRWGKSTVEQRYAELIFEKEKKTGEWRIYTKTWEPLEGVTPRSLLVESDHGRNRDGTQEIAEILSPNVFPNPKPLKLLRHLLAIGAPGADDLVLDFFSGSGTMAHAVLELNRELGLNRRFIAVQLPEPTESESPAYKAGFKTIAEIGKERIRRVIKKLKSDAEGTLPLKTRNAPEDLGVRVFILKESNYKLWTGVQERDSQAYFKTMDGFTDPLLADWKPENLLWEVAVKEGYGLNSEVKPVAGLKSNAVHIVADPNKQQSFRICLDDSLKKETIKSLDLSKDDLFICRDAALDDELASNLALQCRLKTI